MEFSRMKFSNNIQPKEEKPETSGFHFGSRSKKALAGVDSGLVAVAERALELSKLDFGITEGVRTVARQEKLVKEGKSQTMNSRHIDGKAIDIVVYIDGKVNWNVSNYITVAEAFHEALQEEQFSGVKLRWGAAWTELLNYKTAEKAHTSYVNLRKSQGRKAFIDAVHFEIPK